MLVENILYLLVTHWKSEYFYLRLVLILALHWLIFASVWVLPQFCKWNISFAGIMSKVAHKIINYHLISKYLQQWLSNFLTSNYYCGVICTNSTISVILRILCYCSTVISMNFNWGRWEGARLESISILKERKEREERWKKVETRRNEAKYENKVEGKRWEFHHYEFKKSWINSDLVVMIWFSMYLTIR